MRVLHGKVISDSARPVTVPIRFPIESSQRLRDFRIYEPIACFILDVLEWGSSPLLVASEWLQPSARRRPAGVGSKDGLDQACIPEVRFQHVLSEQDADEIGND